MGSHTGNASGDDNDVGILEGSFGAVIGRKVASDGLVCTPLVSSKHSVTPDSLLSVSL
jgi:hypothetical protein